jgi:protein TonB
MALTPLINDTRKLSGTRLDEGTRVRTPKLLREVKPHYTADAMRERIQGTVWMDVEVLEDGMVGQVLVVNSLDLVFGLDDQAVRAVKAWRFRPATLDGALLPVVVTVEMSFTLK